MLNLLKPHALVVTLATALAAAPAWSALQIEREVTITNDAGGSLVMIGSAQRDELGAEGTTTATFTDFAAGTRVINGEVVRSRIATGEQIETSYDGALEIVTAADGERPEHVDTLVFESLTVTRSGTGPELSGSVIFNGRRMDAGELPRPAIRVLARALRFFAFA